MPASSCPIQPVAKTIAEHLDLIPSDVATQVRYGGGILVPLEEDSEKLDRLGRSLAAQEVWTRIVPSSFLGQGERPYRITHLETREETLWARLPNKRELDFRREEIQGIRIHAVEKEFTEVSPENDEFDNQRLIDATLEVGGTTFSERGLALLKSCQEEEKPLPELWITLYLTPPLRPLRWERSGFDYSILGEQKMDHSLDNFLLLVEKLLAEFPEMINRESGDALLSELTCEPILISKPEEVPNFDRWIRAWLSSEKELGQGSSEEEDISSSPSDGEEED